ncbi:hypothetical protein F5B20DRAFT_545367 [Whalleya microplaca]|nr:hypothetical protein F5B20DRAFT_545367 [Whalleya microplaca]
MTYDRRVSWILATALEVARWSVTCISFAVCTYGCSDVRRPAQIQSEYVGINLRVCGHRPGRPVRSLCTIY